MEITDIFDSSMQLGDKVLSILESQIDTEYNDYYDVETITQLNSIEGSYWSKLCFIQKDVKEDMEKEMISFKFTNKGINEKSLLSFGTRLKKKIEKLKQNTI